LTLIYKIITHVKSYNNYFTLWESNKTSPKIFSISSIEIIEEDVEIVSLDVSNTDTYIANGYITHNKGTNSHTDFDGPTAPTSVTYTHPSLSWSGGTPDTDSGGITGYDVQIDNNSDFSSPLIDETQWSETTVVTTTDGGSFDIGTGTRYARVRQYSTNGLVSNYSSTLTFTVS